jgi:hypothetical protein
LAGWCRRAFSLRRLRRRDTPTAYTNDDADLHRDASVSRWLSVRVPPGDYWPCRRRNRRVHGTANPGADGHAVGLGQRADGLDCFRWNANRDMSREGSGVATARVARRRLAVCDLS